MPIRGEPFEFSDKDNKALILKGYKIYSESILSKGEKNYFLVDKDLKTYLVSNDDKFGLPIENISSFGIYEKSRSNALRLRKLFKHLNPQPSGLKKSFGFGDRLGLATSGHVGALGKHEIFPIFAQQSIRELQKTGRKVEEVIDDAMWGVFQAGYKNGYGADIDHVKDEKDIIRAVSCGYTMYTIDSSDYLKHGEKDLPKAIKHITALYNVLKGRASLPFDFEVSIDETNIPTTPSVHVFIVEKLRRNKVEFTSLALRFVGEFEKGIDYIGSLKAFKKDFLAHVGICKRYGGYKLSIHSGSDKFSIYPIIGKGSEVFHVKTSGTSWLEAVRLISRKDPRLFRSLYQVAIDNFGESRRAYHITTTLDKIPDINKLSDKVFPGFLNDNAIRQLLHISYGIILKNLKKEIYSILNLYKEEYYQMLENHLGRHLDLLGVK